MTTPIKMVRIILILVVISLCSMAVSWVTDEPGRVIIDWSFYHIETSMATGLTAIALLTLLFVLSYSVIILLLHTPGQWTRSRLAKRQMLGLESITASFAAIAAHDLAVARKKLLRAQQYLPHQPMTMMLAAQIARLEGNESKSRLYIEKMLGHEVTEFIALRNLIENAVNSGDNTLAIEYAEKALTIKPQDNWLITTIAMLYVKTGRHQDAARLLELSLKKRYIDKQFFYRETAHALYETAKQLTEHKRYDSAISHIKESLKKLPYFPEASSLLAEIYLKKADLKSSINTIEKAWKIAPHKSLRLYLLEILEKSDNRKKIIPSVQKIAKIHPEHEESLMLISDINNISSQWP